MSAEPDPGTRPGPSEHELLSRYGGILSHDTAIYVIAMASVFPFSLLQVAVFTRLLDPAEYGQLALLVFFSSLVTIVMNLVTLQGTFIITFRQGGGEDGDDGMDDGVDDVAIMDDDLGPEALVRDRQLALTTGAVLMVLVIAALALPLALVAGSIGDFLLREDDGTVHLVHLALLSAIAGALYRFLHNLMRMERRPWMFVAIALLRPPLVVGLAIYFVVATDGIEGALLGMATGTAIASLLCLLLSLRSFRIGFSPSYARRIIVAGLPTAAMHMSMWLMHNLDTFFLSRYAGASEVGLYRLASRLASIPTYFVSAYTMAFPPLERTALANATYARYEGRGGGRTVKSYIFTYFIVGCLGIIVTLTICADLLVLIAGPAYHEAANFIPLLSISYVMYGFFTLIIRFSKIKRPRTTRVVLSGFAALLAAGFSILLIPPLGAYGAALAVVLAMSIVNGILLRMAATASREFVVQWGRVGGALLAAVVAWAVGTRLAAEVGPLHAVVGLIGIGLYPALLLATRAVPTYHLAVLAAIARRSVPQPSHRRALVARVQDLPPRRRAILEAVILEGRTAAEIAIAERISRAEVEARLSRAVRQVAGQELAPEFDARVGSYLLLDAATAARDATVRTMMEEGIDPFAIHEIETTYAELQRARPNRRSVGPAASIAWPA